VLALLSFTIGILIGSFAVNTGEDFDAYTVFSGDASRFLINSIDNNRIRNWLQKITENPHVGGTPEEEEGVALMIEEHMKQEGLQVKVSEYQVLLSYPKRQDGLRNYIAIVDRDGNIKKDEKVPIVKVLDLTKLQFKY